MRHVHIANLVKIRLNFFPFWVSFPTNAPFGLIFGVAESTFAVDVQLSR